MKSSGRAVEFMNSSIEPTIESEITSRHFLAAAGCSGIISSSKGSIFRHLRLLIET